MHFSAEKNQDQQQSINQSTLNAQSINQSTLNQSINRSIDHSIDGLINQSIIQRYRGASGKRLVNLETAWNGRVEGVARPLLFPRSSSRIMEANYSVLAQAGSLLLKSCISRHYKRAMCSIAECGVILLAAISRTKGRKCVFYYAIRCSWNWKIGYKARSREKRKRRAGLGLASIQFQTGMAMILFIHASRFSTGINKISVNRIVLFHDGATKGSQRPYHDVHSPIYRHTQWSKLKPKLLIKNTQTPSCSPNTGHTECVSVHTTYFVYTPCTYMCTPCTSCIRVRRIYRVYRVYRVRRVYRYGKIFQSFRANGLMKIRDARGKPADVWMKWS